MKELFVFSFYLDAVQYCRNNGIELSRIIKKNFRQWNVEGVYTPASKK